MLRKLLLLSLLSLSCVLKSQTLHWVGGSGNISDKDHWSLVSGGVSAGISPSPATDLVFDDNAGNQDLIINIVGMVHVKSIHFININHNYFVTGSTVSSLNCSGDFVLNGRTFFEANTKLVFSNALSNAGIIDFSRNKLNADVLFEKGNWDIKVLKVADQNTVTFLKGTYNVQNCLLTAGNLIANTGPVIFNSTKSPFKIQNKLALGSNVLFNSNDQIMIANTGNAQLFQVDPSITFGQNSKVVNPNPQACIVTTSFTNSPCGNSCSASFAINFDPGCVNGPYDIIFSTSAPCIPTGTNSINPPSLVYTNLCNSCAGYQVDGVVFDNLGNFETTFSGFTQQIVSPISINYMSIRSPVCFGVCDGSISFFLNSGKQPYTVTIDPTSLPPGQTFTNVPAIVTQTATGLCAGVHTISVTDANGCTQLFTQTISPTPPINPNGVTGSITCNASCNGTASVSPTGGLAPYTYSWLSSSSTPSTSTTSGIGNLCPGVVTMTVTDSKTCTATFSANIVQPPAITLTVTKTNLNCGSVCNGTASVTATGGLGAFTYSWAPSGGSGASATGLCAGNYTVTVTNNVNCVKTITVDILSPPTLTASPVQSNISCNAVCNGSVNLHPGGGTPGYTYGWSPAVSTGSTAINLCAGPYTYTITDGLGCTLINTITITQPPAATLTVAGNSITCNGACDGTATGNMSGGTTPYTYSWTPTGLGTPAITNLCVGNYTLRVTDANGCVISRTVSIAQPAPITASITMVSPTCNGLCNGSITTSPSGGTLPYTYTLQSSSGPPVFTNPPFTGLCVGSYTLHIRDNSGCVITRTVSLTQPNAVTLTLNSTPISCFNQCNASIATVVNGGTPGYTYLWNTGSTSSALINQCAGAYSATVTDAAGCIATASVTITSPTDMTVAITPVNPNCNSFCTGVATASASGGTPNYTYNWSTGTVGPVTSNLCAGNYTVTVTDFLGCIKTQNVTISTPPPVTLTPVNGTVSCAGSCNATISVNPSGGTPNYFYSWSSVPTQTTQSASGLCVGNYVVSVTDSKGCIASTNVNVAQPPALTANISNVQSSCNVCIGAATGSGVGGTAPYSYVWSNGVLTPTVTGLCVGVYTLTVTDASNCVATQTVNIAQTVIVLVTSNGNTLTCNGGCTGIATANATGGTLPYSFTWTPTNQTTQTATALCAGTHTVLVEDINGCSNTDQISFTDPLAISLNVTQTDVTCNGSCNGTASATATGGTGAISYLWQPGNITTPGITGLCPGSYTVTASDANNCSKTQVITITEASSLTVTFTQTNPTTCTTNDGSISFVPSGGVGPYTFTWTPGPSTNPIINLADGSYVLTLSDANNCIRTFTASLSDPIGPTVAVTSTSINCFGSCTGAATLAITGVSPISVNWPSVPSTNTVVTGLCAGNYVAMVTDGNSCVTNQTVSIAQPLQITASGVVTNVSCNAACTASINLTTTGGTAPYAYSWSPAGSGEDPTGLCAGNYTVAITDANSCPATHSFVVNQPAPLTLNFNKRDVQCNGGCTGSVRAVVGGGTTPYTYIWTPVGSFAGSNIDTIINLCTGIYSVTASDANGCSITGTISIGEPALLTSTITTINNLCNAQCNGSATITPTGGTSPYSYSYNTTPPTVTPVINGLCSGTYNGMVTDAHGCVSQHTFSITQPLPIVVTSTVSNPLCNGSNNGSIATSVTGGTPGYTYNWIPAGGNVPNPTGLAAGNYTVIVTDANSCTGTGLATLVNPPLLLANTSFTNPQCGGGCSGVVTASPAGGTGPYSYLWTAPTSTSQTVTGLCAGNYTVIVTDANLCQNTQTLTLVPPVVVTLNPGITPASCGLNNGSINAAVSSGNPNFTYNWLPPVPAAQSTFSLVTGLGAGIYTVVVTDASACTATAAIALSNSNGPSSATITFTDVACNAQCNGAAAVSNPVGGTAPYVLSWVSPVATGSLVTGLCQGSYMAQITDANNCILFEPVTISQPQAIDDNEAIVSALCSGNCTGSIALSPTGGNGGYTYSWSNSATTQTVSNLCPGVYSVTITDSKNCTFNGSYNVLSLTTITSSTFVTNNVCFPDCNGISLATNVAGGLPPYSFNWSDPFGQSNAQANGLCNGSYSVTITDANGCFSVIPAAITSPSPVSITPTVLQPSCGQCNGSATVLPTGGTPTYSLVWSNTQTGTNISNLCAGVYMVQITDGNGCVSNSNVIINSSSTITGETITQSNISCAGVCDGTVSVTAIGGTGPVTYNWVHNNSASQTLTGLCAGTYYCNMTDANGCSRTASVTIAPASVLSFTSHVTQSSCSSNTGSVTVSVSGGTGAYTYAWLPAGNTATLTNMAPGSYTLTVTDGAGCSKTQVYSIGTINGPVVSFTKSDVKCSGACDGTVALNIMFGTPAYTVQWSNSATTPTVGGLCAGSYSVQVTDAAGCKAIQNISINNPSPIVFSAPDADQPVCYNDCNGSLTAIPIGGTLPYVFTWTPGAVNAPTTNSLCAGNYSINITDANGCTVDQTYTIINPTIITLTGLVTNASCSTSPDGAITTTVTGGNPNYTYSWTPGGVTTPALTNVLPNTYTLTLIDNNGTGCRKDTVFTITPSIVVNAVAGNDTTFCQNGSLLLNGSNSVGGTVYQWFELPSTTAISNTLIVTLTPATGTNTYVLVASNGVCVDSDTVFVTSNPLPVVDAGPFTDIPIYSTATIGGNPTSASGTTFNWLPSGTLDNPIVSNPITSTTVTTIFTVTVVDANGCMNSDTVTVFVHPEIRIPNGFSPNGDGKNDVWQLDMIYLFPDNEVEVYNRWGEQLFYSKGYPVPFNGQYKGKNLPVGTYYYVIRLNHPAYPEAYTGPLTIFR